MPRRNFNDDISILSEDKILFSRSRSKSRSRRLSSPRLNGLPPSSSQSVSAASSSENRSRSMRSLGSMRKRFSLRGFKAEDDISISDSLCSGVLRDAVDYNGSGSNIGDSGKSMGGIGSSARSAQSANTTPIPGGVADFNAQFSQYNKKPSQESDADSKLTNSFHSSGPSSIAMSSAVEEQVRREQRKERVKEKLDRYKRDQKQLKQSCVALENQLSQTTQKLREVDSKAAFKIDSLESELRETRMGMEHVAKQSTKEVTGQSECIKTLGKKLIRQAHVIKRQKAAVENYKVKLEAMHEEMAMQDERDSRRDDELDKIKEQLENTKEQKVQMQNLLQESIEEMMDLKTAVEKDAKNIMELEFHMQQKEATLDRVAKEVSEKTLKICELEEDLESKDLEVEGVREELKESESSADVMRQELEKATEEIEELRCKYAAWGTSRAVADAVNGAGGDQAHGPGSRSASLLGINWKRQTSTLSLMGEDGADAVETFEAELEAKDATIQTLDYTVKDHEETIKTLTSDKVKMSVTYKQDSYLKRKEITKLKQQNAEMALKFRALEKAFKCVNATENMPMFGSKFHGHTMHGSPPRQNRNGSTSIHGKSMHSVDSLASKEDKAAAVKARLGMVAPYEFPTANQLHQDSLIVQQSNFFDRDTLLGGSDAGSDLGGKGENPEEC